MPMGMNADVYFAIFLSCILYARGVISDNANQGTGLSSKIEVRVVNGWNARPFEFPWQVSLRIRQTNSHICGGSLINQFLVLTSAHCVLMNPCSTTYNVVLGAHMRKGKTIFQQERQVKRWYVHSYFSNDHFKKDVALLWLNRPIRMTRAVHAIQLPPPWGRVAVGTMCYISGWGRTKSNGQYSNILQKAVMQIIPYQTCAKRNNKLFRVDYRSMVCARGLGRAGGCKGDSGGPLTCWERKRWVLRGVVSWGHKKCNTNYYTVFARVSNLVKWIKYTARRG